jgi:hypothetical protein
MRIAIIGGREKNEVELSRIAVASGHELEFHDGHVAGRGAATIGNLVARADLVVIVTDINSHLGVNAAKAQAKTRHKPSLVINRLSGARLRGLLNALDRRDALSWVGRLSVTDRARALQSELNGRAA